MQAVSSHTQTGPHPMRRYIAGQLQAGVDRDTIVAELGKSGIEEQTARKLVEDIYQETLSGPIKLGESSSSIQAALLGGLAASLVAGAIWGGVALLTGWELGLMAWFVGAAVGYAVLLFSKGETGSIHQIIAVGYSILGILIGRYVTFYVILKDFVQQELGPETAAGMSIFSPQLFSEFIRNLGEIFGMWDLLWMAFACITAWKLTGDRG